MEAESECGGRDEAGRPTTKSNATMNYGAEPFDDPQYVVGQIVQVSAKGQDSRMRSVKAKINAIVPSNGEWGYRLDTPAENRVYLETEID